MVFRCIDKYNTILLNFSFDFVFLKKLKFFISVVPVGNGTKSQFLRNCSLLPGFKMSAALANKLIWADKLEHHVTETEWFEIGHGKLPFLLQCDSFHKTGSVLVAKSIWG